MPRVRLLVPLNVNGSHLHRGAILDVDGDLAASLTGLGRVELVRGEQPDTPERQTSFTAEKTSRARKAETT